MLEQVRLSWRSGESPRPVVAAVSGGADSVALLLALAHLAPQEGFSLTAAHVDHQIRPDSGQDAAFVRSLCDALSIPCRAFAVAIHGSSEDAARAARYAALLNGFPEYPGFTLALAHHQRDQAETMLLHLFRGSGGAGLAGMRERSSRPLPGGNTAVLWRPLLNVSPDVIRAALREKGVSWREDGTNAQDAYLRNYVRHRVLPVIRARMPEAEAAMGRTAAILSEEQAYFQQEAEAFLRRDRHACLRDPFRWVRYAPLQALHPALRRHVIRLICPVLLEERQTEALCVIAPGETINLPRGWRAYCASETLHFLPPEDRAFPAATPDPGALRVLPWQGETGDGIRTQAMPRALYAQCALRLRRPGDRIHPLGAKGSKSIQDYFVDKKVPKPFRVSVPLLCVGGRVVWAIGVGPGEEARVRPDDDAVLLSYEGFLPGDVPDITP